MQRYFIREQYWSNDEVRITENNAHHIIRVMRNEVGNQIICNHPNGEAARCTITEIINNEVRAKISEWLVEDAELPVQVTIAQGLPKGNKLELILQKGTELGAHRFSLFQAARSIVKWDHKKSAQKIKRYEKIIEEASEQCHRNLVPLLNQYDSLEQLLANSKSYDHILFAYEEEAKRAGFSSFSSVLRKVKKDDKIIVFIGPEGGFSEEEVQLLIENNAIPVRLGKRILRTETAPLYVLASISYHFEELRCDE